MVATIGIRRVRRPAYVGTLFKNVQQYISYFNRKKNSVHKADLNICHDAQAFENRIPTQKAFSLCIVVIAVGVKEYVLSGH